MSEQQRAREHTAAPETSVSPSARFPAPRCWVACVIAVALAVNAALLYASLLRPADVVGDGGVVDVRTTAVSMALKGDGSGSDTELRDTAQTTRTSSPLQESRLESRNTIVGQIDGAFDHLPALQGVAVKPRRALVTFLQNDAYVAGALTLAYTLRKHGNALPLVLLTIEGPDGQLSAAAVQVLKRAGWQLRPVKGVKPFKATIPRFEKQYTKLRLFDMADDFDLLLYLDADILVIGRQEAALDFFAPGGKARHPVGAVHDFKDDGSFNAGVMALRPSHALFREMINAARDNTVEWEARFAEQAFLNAFLKRQHGWTLLPVGYNVLTANYERRSGRFNRHIRNATAIHFIGVTGKKVMADRITFSADGSRVVSTSHGERGEAWGVLDAMWIEAWTEARHTLGLPVEPTSNVTSRHSLEPEGSPS